jgi:hypothetical protein
MKQRSACMSNHRACRGVPCEQETHGVTAFVPPPTAHPARAVRWSPAEGLADSHTSSANCPLSSRYAELLHSRVLEHDEQQAAVVARLSQLLADLVAYRQRLEEHQQALGAYQVASLQLAGENANPPSAGLAGWGWGERSASFPVGGGGTKQPLLPLHLEGQVALGIVLLA